MPGSGIYRQQQERALGAVDFKSVPTLSVRDDIHIDGEGWIPGFRYDSGLC